MSQFLITNTFTHTHTHTYTIYMYLIVLWKILTHPDMVTLEQGTD